MAGWFLHTHVREQFRLVEELSPTEEVYGTVMVVILNFHAVHLLAGLGVGLFVVLQLLTGRVTARRPEILTVGSLYWHFVDEVWVVVYSLLYLSPHVLGRT